MRILQLCKKFPYPLKDGEAIAVNSISKSLHQLGCEVTLLAMNTTKHYYDIKQLPLHFNHYKAIHTVLIDNRLKLWDAFLNLFSEKSYHISRFESAAFKHKLIELLQAQPFDIIQLESPYLAPYIPVIQQYSKAKIAMRAHNVEYEIWQRVAHNCRFLPKKWYLQHLTKKLRRYEIAQLNNYDLLIPITQRDLDIFQFLGYKNAAVVAPVGVHSKDYPADFSSFNNALSLGFIGSLDWMPNQEGLRWFLDEVWHHLQQRFPDLTFHIAGRNAPNWLRQLNLPNVIFHGEVPDAAAFINQHSVMVVPLFSGSGMRVKILEGMALGRVVVTTSMGLEGIDAQHLKEVLLADTVESFVEAIALCRQDATFARKISEQARNFILRHYDNQAIALQLLQAYALLLPEQPKTLTLQEV
ncbi:MAG: glycosyltransferase family 4 protein [Saprospiraceae bacterium]